MEHDQESKQDDEDRIDMNIQKQEAERTLKASSKVIAITLRKADTPTNKKQEHQSLTRLVDQKVTQGKEITVSVIEH